MPPVGATADNLSAALQPHEKGAWAPTEGTPEAVAYLAQLKKLFS